MNTNNQPILTLFGRSRLEGWILGAIAPLSFAAGSLLTARLMHANQVRADSHRVFQLMVYHTLPGKVPDLESIFRDVAKLQAKHGQNVIGYWVPYDDPAWANTFVYLVAQPSQEEARKNWDALHADPAFPPYRQQAAPLIEKDKEAYRVDEVYMRPTDYSSLN